MAQLRETDRLERRAKDIVERLHGVWRRGRGMCCCPAHEDRIPSLSVTLGRTAILFHCFAGCSSEAVMEALEQQGVRPTQLFDGATERPLVPADRTDHARAAFRLWLSATSIVGSAARGTSPTGELRPGRASCAICTVRHLGQGTQCGLCRRWWQLSEPTP